MYVNLVTGECGWDAPQNVCVRQSNDNQWWELFDQNNNRFYYYNALTKQTVWHRPQNCDVVPLARLQAMKRNSQSESRVRLSGDCAQLLVSGSGEGRGFSAQVTGVQDAERGKKAVGALQDSVGRKESGRSEARLAFVNVSRRISQSVVHFGAQVHFPLAAGSGQQGRHVGQSGQRNKHGSASATSHPGRQPPKISDSQSPRPQSCPPTPPPPPPLGGSLPLAGKTPSSSLEHKPSLHLKKTENGGFCLVLSNSPCQTPQPGPGLAQQPSSPKCASSAPIYDEPPIESPIYDEPPMEVDPASLAQHQPSQQQQQQQKVPPPPLKLLQTPGFPGQQQQPPPVVTKHARKPSNTEYSPAGREYIKHMVNIDQSSKQSLSPTGSCDRATRAYAAGGALTAKDGNKQPWKLLDVNSIKSIDGQHSRQSSLQSQEYPISVVSQQDSGYSTGPSPSLRRRKGRRTMAGQARPGSLGSTSELNVLNDKLMAEMRAVVNRSAVIRGSRASLNAELAETCILADIHKIRLQCEGRHVRPYSGRGSRDDVSASNRSLHKTSPDVRASVDGELATQQEVAIRQKRTFEKVDFSCNSLEKSLTSQISLNSPDPVRNPPQNISGSPQSTPGGQACTVGYHFSYTTLRKPLPEKSMADWASKHLNMHTQGIFRRRISIANMLSWVNCSIKKPMLITSDRTIKKEACELFKLVQMYMGDRQSRMERVPIALVIVTKCWSMQGIRDEFYIQLCRQTTDNLSYKSLASGWELMAVCLAFFSPSPKFQSYLEGYIYRHTDPSNDVKVTQRIKELLEVKNKKFSKSRKKRKQNSDEEEDLAISTYAKYCYRKLQKVTVTGGKKGLRKPTIEEIHHAKNAIVTPSMFGSSLEEIMERQRERYPERKLPWVQTQLSNKVLALGGAQTEGIFRVPGDIDEVNALKLQVDQWRIPENLADPHIPASLLKLWYRELEEPLIPQTFYPLCVNNYENPEAAVAVVASLPEINRLVLGYLIHFLQIFAQPANVGKTKMDVNNLAMVMAPNCLRCQSDDPRIIFENTRKEMSFLRLLIVHLDTSFIKGDL
eukprot:gi/632980165/ref/XP_007906880.1/ PREDICTED: rho GTPase-activating protein 39-like [Callorhinchus milii]